MAALALALLFASQTAAAPAVEQVHLALGTEPSTMAVQWVEQEDGAAPNTGTRNTLQSTGKRTKVKMTRAVERARYVASGGKESARRDDSNAPGGMHGRRRSAEWRPEHRAGLPWGGSARRGGAGTEAGGWRRGGEAERWRVTRGGTCSTRRASTASTCFTDTMSAWACGCANLSSNRSWARSRGGERRVKRGSATEIIDRRRWIGVLQSPRPWFSRNTPLSAAGGGLAYDSACSSWGPATRTA